LGDRLGTVFSVGIQGIPVFVSGLLAQYLFGVLPFQLGWDWLNFFKPWPQTWALGVIPTDGWKGIILPALVVAVVDAAFIARMLRSSLLEVLRADYIRTAFAKGLSARRVWFHHALRNAYDSRCYCLWNITYCNLWRCGSDRESFLLAGHGFNHC